MLKFPTEDLTGVIHGHLLPTKVLLWNSEGHPLVYDCECLFCGREHIEVTTTDLAWFRVRSCGCVPHNDIYKMKFNRLTALRETDQIGKDGHLLWEWVCDCGKHIFRDKDTVVSGNTTSCGCAQIDQRFIRPFEDLSSKTFGKWSVLYRVPHKPYDRKTYYHCKCECGTERDVDAVSLRNGKSVSCGECTLKENGLLRRVNLIGFRSGKLKVISPAPDKIYPNGRVLTMWNCVCECGNTRTIATQTLLKRAYKSCGDCKHTRGFTKDPIYKRWCSMINRCYCKSTTEYANYGGRGISVCDEWRNNFLSFRNWSIENGFRQDLSIDRIDNDGNYCPENCRWATMKEQQNNRSTCRYITINGIKNTLTRWAESIGKTYDNLRNKSDNEITEMIKNNTI